jgi:hypothetical protein
MIVVTGTVSICQNCRCVCRHTFDDFRRIYIEQRPRFISYCPNHFLHLESQIPVMTNRDFVSRFDVLGGEEAEMDSSVRWALNTD